MILNHCLQVISEGSPFDAFVSVAAKSGVHGDMRNADAFPVGDGLAPVVRASFRVGDPYGEAGSTSTALFSPISAELVECTLSLVAFRMGQHDPAIAVFGDPAQGFIHMAAKPNRHAAVDRQRVDASIVDIVPLALEGDVLFRPEALHDVHLLHRAHAAVAEIHAQADKLDRVLADADAKAEPPAG